MKQYLDFLKMVRDKGTIKSDRTGTGTKSIFSHQMRFDLNEGFPLVTTKRVHIPSVVHELLWFLKGDTNIKYLQDNKVNIWNEWADKMVIWVQFMVLNGANGIMLRAERLIKSQKQLNL